MGWSPKVSVYRLKILWNLWDYRYTLRILVPRVIFIFSRDRIFHGLNNGIDSVARSTCLIFSLTYCYLWFPKSYVICPKSYAKQSVEALNNILNRGSFFCRTILQPLDSDRAENTNPLFREFFLEKWIGNVRSSSHKSPTEGYNSFEGRTGFGIFQGNVLLESNRIPICLGSP